MLYTEKTVILPDWLYKGAEVCCDGEGSEVLTVEEIEYQNDKPHRIVLSNGCYEPWAKIYHPVTKERVPVSVGHCDNCEVNFSDSHVRFDVEGKNYCDPCYKN